MEKHNIPKQLLRKKLLISSLGGEMEATYRCSKVNLKIMGIDFIFDLVLLKSNRIDVFRELNTLTYLVVAI